MLEKIEGKRNTAADDEMVGWYHQLDGHAFEQVLGVGDGQRSLACCSPWGRKESDTTEATQQQQQQGKANLYLFFFSPSPIPLPSFRTP